VIKTQTAGPISCLEHCATRVLYSIIVTRAAVLTFPLVLQSITSNQMRPRMLRGAWFSRLLLHPARRWSRFILSPGTQGSRPIPLIYGSVGNILFNVSPRRRSIRNPVDYNVPSAPRGFYPKQHLDPFSQFCRAQSRYRQTHHATGSSAAIVRISCIRCGLIIILYSVTLILLQFALCMPQCFVLLLQYSRICRLSVVYTENKWNTK